MMFRPAAASSRISSLPPFAALLLVILLAGSFRNHHRHHSVDALAFAVSSTTAFDAAAAASEASRAFVSGNVAVREMVVADAAAVGGEVERISEEGSSGEEEGEVSAEAAGVEMKRLFDDPLLSLVWEEEEDGQVPSGDDPDTSGEDGDFYFPSSSLLVAATLDLLRGVAKSARTDEEEEASEGGWGYQKRELRALLSEQVLAAAQQQQLDWQQEEEEEEEEEQVEDEEDEGGELWQLDSSDSEDGSSSSSLEEQQTRAHRQQHRPGEAEVFNNRSIVQEMSRHAQRERRRKEQQRGRKKRRRRVVRTRKVPRRTMLSNITSYEAEHLDGTILDDEPSFQRLLEQVRLPTFYYEEYSDYEDDDEGVGEGGDGNYESDGGDLLDGGFDGVEEELLLQQPSFDEDHYTQEIVEPPTMQFREPYAAASAAAIAEEIAASVPDEDFDDDEEKSAPRRTAAATTKRRMVWGLDHGMAELRVPPASEPAANAAANPSTTALQFAFVALPSATRTMAQGRRRSRPYCRRRRRRRKPFPVSFLVGGSAVERRHLLPCSLGDLRVEPLDRVHARRRRIVYPHEAFSAFPVSAALDACATIEEGRDELLLLEEKRMAVAAAAGSGSVGGFVEVATPRCDISELRVEPVDAVYRRRNRDRSLLVHALIDIDSPQCRLEDLRTEALDEVHGKRRRSGRYQAPQTPADLVMSSQQTGPGSTGASDSLAEGLSISPHAVDEHEEADAFVKTEAYLDGDSLVRVPADESHQASEESFLLNDSYKLGEEEALQHHVAPQSALENQSDLEEEDASACSAHRHGEADADFGVVEAAASDQLEIEEIDVEAQSVVLSNEGGAGSGEAAEEYADLSVAVNVAPEHQAIEEEVAVEVLGAVSENEGEAVAGVQTGDNLGHSVAVDSSSEEQIMDDEEGGEEFVPEAQGWLRDEEGEVVDLDVASAEEGPVLKAPQTPQEDVEAVTSVLDDEGEIVGLDVDSTDESLVELAASLLDDEEVALNVDSAKESPVEVAIPLLDEGEVVLDIDSVDEKPVEAVTPLRDGEEETDAPQTFEGDTEEVTSLYDHAEDAEIDVASADENPVLESPQMLEEDVEAATVDTLGLQRSEEEVSDLQTESPSGNVSDRGVCEQSHEEEATLDQVESSSEDLLDLAGARAEEVVEEEEAEDTVSVQTPSRLEDEHHISIELVDNSEDVATVVEEEDGTVLAEVEDVAAFESIGEFGLAELSDEEAITSKPSYFAFDDEASEEEHSLPSDEHSASIGPEGVSGDVAALEEDDDDDSTFVELYDAKGDVVALESIGEVELAELSGGEEAVESKPSYFSFDAEVEEFESDDFEEVHGSKPSYFSFDTESEVFESDEDEDVDGPIEDYDHQLEAMVDSALGRDAATDSDEGEETDGASIRTPFVDIKVSVPQSVVDSEGDSRAKEDPKEQASPQLDIEVSEVYSDGANVFVGRRRSKHVRMVDSVSDEGDVLDLDEEAPEHVSSAAHEQASLLGATESAQQENLSAVATSSAVDETALSDVSARDPLTGIELICRDRQSRVRKRFLQAVIPTPVQEAPSTVKLTMDVIDPIRLKHKIFGVDETDDTLDDIDLRVLREGCDWDAMTSFGSLDSPVLDDLEMLWHRWRDLEEDDELLPAEEQLLVESNLIVRALGEDDDGQP